MSNSQGNDKSPFLPGTRVEVLLPRPFDHGFDYVVPDDMQLHTGDYVSVPFGPKQMIGVIWCEGTQEVVQAKCKAILAHHDWLPPMPQPMRALIEFVANYTLSPKGMALKLALPMPTAITKPPTEASYRLAHVEAGTLSAGRKKVIEALQTQDGQTASALKAATGASDAVLLGMRKTGMIRREETIALPPRPAFSPMAAPPLREEQQRAATALHTALNQGFSVSALEGVTGSGKTEVYFDLIETLFKQTDDAQVLVLLPEIALTTQWLERFEARFGPTAALWHSSVSEAKRKHTWQMVAHGKTPLVVGARSALFLPFANLRAIIVDEEHEGSYKQEEGVLYHARDMAVARAKQENIPVLLCSATLSLETKQNATEGKYSALHLTERHGAYNEPTPELIDLRADKPDSGNFLSPSLRKAILDTIGNGYQAMLFLNRRGYAPLLLCRSCGHRFDCHQCSAWMVQHTRPDRLECHHCGWKMTLPDHCPECGSEDLAPCGPGVERIAEEAAALLPEAKLAVLSSDEGELGPQLEAIVCGETQLIIGTQMLAKGHHFPGLALVGVVDGDLGLENADLRAGERTYQLLHQLAGRAGREDIPGRVLIQTTQPEHPLMQALQRGDREGFMREEMRRREEGHWPPFGRLAGLLFEGVNEARVRDAAVALMRSAPRYEGITYLGPAPAAMARTRGKYRYRILVKAPKSTALQQILRNWTESAKLPSGVRLKVDIDPYQMM